MDAGSPELAVAIDRKKMADLGLSLDVVGSTMQNAFAGNDNNKFAVGDDEYAILVRLDQFNRKNYADISNLSFLNGSGVLIKLSQFATIQPSSDPSTFERKDKIPTITVEAQVVCCPIGTVGNGGVNLNMLLVCHYNYPINLTQFQEVNHGRYKIENGNSISEPIIIYMGNFKYYFDSSTEILLYTDQI